MPPVTHLPVNTGRREGAPFGACGTTVLPPLKGGSTMDAVQCATFFSGKSDVYRLSSTFYRLIPLPVL